MIFNPYNLAQLTEEVAETDSGHLSWAAPLLQDNMFIIGLVLACCLIDILACCRNGIIMHQITWIFDTRSSRTFETSLVILPWLQPLLMTQIFLFSGLCLYCIFDPDAAGHLSSWLSVDWMLLLGCIAIALGWYLLQKLLFNWFCYLFGMKEKRDIMNRSYKASWITLAPVSMIVFILLISGAISSQIALILLAAIFILSQIAFIFNGIKIFYDGISSLFFIFVYLCTLEIAPLLVIWAKITT